MTWTATDGGSGVASGPTPASKTETANGVTTLTSTATDRLGNVSTGSKTVQVDKSAPSIVGTAVSGGYGQPTVVTFTCDDSNSGGGQAQSSGIATCVADASPTNSTSVTVTTNGPVTGTAIDRAGNRRTATVDVQNIDTTPPTLSGAPTTLPNQAGWYRDDVTVHWTAADPESGIAGDALADTVITGEGTDLTISASVSNGAGGTTTAQSAPAVKIDRNPPTTAISGPSNDWINESVEVTLAATDPLSGVATTSFSVDGEPAQEGTSFTLSDDGDHTVTYFSTDNAGNAEAAHTVHVRIDQEKPAIHHEFDPTAYVDGAWTNGPVTVTFICEDQTELSDIESCTDPVTESTEGSYTIDGAAVDVAGNTRSDMATVNIDTTAPSVTAEMTGSPNAAGWYREDVTVGWSAKDTGGSGVDPTQTSAPTVLHQGRSQTVTGHASDFAGNTGEGVTDNLDIDTTGPELTGTADIDGWQQSAVTVTWTCSDDLSGVADEPGTSTVTGEGANLSGTASCTDVAGNTTTQIVEGIKIDHTAPTTTARTTPAGPGWQRVAVEVTLEANDNLSGATISYSIDNGDAVAYDEPFSAPEGSHVLTFWSTDGAGNQETVHTLTLQVDTVAPVVTFTPTPAEKYHFQFVPTFACAASDAASGLAGRCVVAGGGTEIGTHQVTATATDNAGNATTVSADYTVSSWSTTGFGSPVSARTVNSVKGGSTVPVKFSLSAGSIELSETSRVSALTVQPTTCTTARTPIAGATVQSLIGTDPTLLRYDAVAHQFIANWRVPAGAGCYRLTMLAADRTTTMSADFTAK